MWSLKPNENLWFAYKAKFVDQMIYCIHSLWYTYSVDYLTL